MPDEIASLVLEHLRVMRAKLDDIAADVAELKQRMGRLEGQAAHLFGQYAILSNRVDRIDTRLERIEGDWTWSMRERAARAASPTG